MSVTTALNRERRCTLNHGQLSVGADGSYAALSEAALLYGTGNTTAVAGAVSGSGNAYENVGAPGPTIGFKLDGGEEVEL